MRKPAFALLLAAVLSISVIPAHAQVVIIASPDMKIESISRQDLRDLFTGASQNLSHGSHVSPVLLTWTSPTHNQFLQTYIGEKAGDFRAEWISQLFAGKQRLPTTLATEADVVDYVFHHPTTIGYIAQTTRHPGVNVLTIK